MSHQRPRSVGIPASPLHVPAGGTDPRDLERPTIVRQAEAAARAEQLKRTADDNAVALRALRDAGFADTDAARGAIAVINALARAGRLA